MRYLLTDYENRTLKNAFISHIRNSFSDMWGWRCAWNLHWSGLGWSVFYNFMLLNYRTSKSKFWWKIASGHLLDIVKLSLVFKLESHISCEGFHSMITSFPQCNFSLEFPEILSQNCICCHWLSVSGISKTMHFGILITMPCCLLLKLRSCM